MTLPMFLVREKITDANRGQDNQIIMQLRWKKEALHLDMILLKSMSKIFTMILKSELITLLQPTSSLSTGRDNSEYRLPPLLHDNLATNKCTYFAHSIQALTNQPAE